jgi:hypothetical protein
MRPLSIGAILFSAFMLVSPTLMFGRGEGVRAFKYSRTPFQGLLARNRSMGARSGGYVMSPMQGRVQSSVGLRSNPGDSAFRK